jgi:hypothetical protein
LALVLDQGLEGLAVGQADDQLGGRALVDEAFDHARDAVGAVVPYGSSWTRSGRMT